MSQEQRNSHSSSAHRSKGLYVGIAVGVVIIIALIGVILYLVLRPNKEQDTVLPDNRATIVTSENVQDVLEQETEPVVAGTYYCSMNTEWHFKDSSQPSYDAYVTNSTDNSYTVYFDVTLEDTNELVYSSPYMEVGAELQDLTLTEPLSAGEYPAIVTYHLVDDQHETLSSVSVTVTLIVEK
jgi:hypothetical protein